MKTTILSGALILVSFFSHSQETSSSIDDKSTYFVLKTKIGISQLELQNSNNINGNITQVEALLSSKLSTQHRIEYGLGFSQFNGNNVVNNNLADIKNNNLRLPINLIYNRDYDKNISLIYGIGIYGTYYAKTDIKGYFEGSGAGINFGASVQFGSSFKISERLSFKVLMEVQRDLTKISKPNNIEIRERMNALVGLNFGYRF